MRVYGYARVSTEEQVKSGSLEQQAGKIKSYCDSQDHELVKLFTDAGVSALKERPEFEKMMETIEDEKDKDQEVDGIVVTKLDRFGRSVKDLVMNMDSLQEKEMDFISIGDSLDTSTPNGKLLFHILSAFAEFEREIIRERPEFEKMMESIEDGKDKSQEVDGIVVTKLDRFGRSVKDLVMNMDSLQEEGMDFISIGDSLDTSTPNGKLLFHILSAFAEFEREIIRERMQAGRERAKAEGKKLHRPKKDLDEERIKELYTKKGLSARAIAKLMDVSPPTILSRLKEMGVEIRGGG